MSKAGSKDTVVGATRLKNAIILFAVDSCSSSILIHTQPLSNIFTPPANLSPQFQFTLSKARAENGKPIFSVERFSGAIVSTATGRERIAPFTALYDKSVAVIQSSIFEALQKAKADKLTLGLPAR